MNSTIPVLVTLDIHSFPETCKEIPAWIEKTLQVFNELSIKATFLFPAIPARQFSSYVQMIIKEKHEIGCHGLAHGLSEQYNSMTYKKQADLLRKSKSIIEAIAQQRVTTFRAPVFKINADTVKALEDNGFTADISVNPQRLGLLSSELSNTGWLYAPRTPYHPSRSNPFRRGKSTLWEIPQSAFILPFMSNTGIALGGFFMKIFFKALHVESIIRKNPIVYMLHVEDVYPRKMKHEYRFIWKHLLPSREHGFAFRYLLFHNKSGEAVSRQIINLLKTMKNSKKVEFLTVQNMVELLNKNELTKTGA